MYDIDYNGTTGKMLGVAITTRPAIPVPQKRGEYVQVAGRDGSLFVSDGTYQDIQFEIQMNFVRAEHFWHDTARRVRNWLSGSGILRLGNDPEWHYRVKNASSTQMDNISKKGAVFTASFVCEPFQYHDGGQVFMDVDQVSLNPFHECQPVYEIHGTGEFVLEVNGNEVSGTSDGVAYIDTEKMIAYKDSQTRVVTSGDFEGLYLKNGQNAISINNGFTLKIKPNWRSL